jgi:signal transduction histidine kinase
MVLIFVFLLLELRFPIALTVGWLVTGVAVATVLWVPASFGLRIIALEVLLISTLLLTLAGYKTEHILRDAFLAARRLLALERRQREAIESRADWLENMARFLRHELRNAVIGVKTSLQLLGKKDGRQGDTYLQRAGRGMQTIGGVLDTVGDATSIESAIYRQPAIAVSLTRLLARQIEAYRDVYAERRILEDLAPGVVVQASETALIQALDNLVANAVEHAVPGTDIEISLRKEEGECVFAVSNQGPALPDETDRLFDLFRSWRADERQGHYGMGLYVVRLVAERFGGGVSARSLEDGTGAVFEVRLPVSR